MLTVNRVHSGYGDLPVLRDVSLSVAEREIMVLLGANGAGKTTLVKTISAMLKPTSGTILFDGLRLDRCRPQEIIRHGMVHVPEGRRLFSEMTVAENLQMGALYGEAKTKRRETFKAVLALFPRLEALTRRTAGTLSGGEQQMVAIGRGLMSRPRFMMLDEPSLGLSPIMVDAVFDVIRKIREQGVTLLLVEQNVHRALDICDRAVVMENGVICREGTGAELSSDAAVGKAYLGV